MLGDKHVSEFRHSTALSLSLMLPGSKDCAKRAALSSRGQAAADARAVAFLGFPPCVELVDVVHCTLAFALELSWVRDDVVNHEKEFLHVFTILHVEINHIDMCVYGFNVQSESAL